MKVKIINQNLKKIKLSTSTKNQLIEIFKDEIIELEGLIDRDLSKWWQ